MKNLPTSTKPIRGIPDFLYINFLMSELAKTVTFFENLPPRRRREAKVHYRLHERKVSGFQLSLINT